MGERKVLNKYYPPDFDPAKIPRRKQEKNRRMKVRMMLPMSIRCNTCGTYIYKGTKFNSNKEDVIGETYLGIQIFRFYFKCTRCSAELTMKTDPQNSDYIVESGAARNFEPWRNEEELTENEKRKREAEEMGDAMKSLENKASDSKKDMDILAALEEMRSMKSRHENVSLDVMLDALKRSETEQGKPIVDVDEEDEAIIKSIVFQNSENFVWRLPDDDDEDIDGNLVQSLSNSNNPEVLAQKRKGEVGNPTDYLSTTTIFNHSRTGDGGSLSLKPKFIVKPRAVADVKKPRSEPAEDEKTSVESTNEKAKVAVASGLQSLCQNYDSDESE